MTLGRIAIAIVLVATFMTLGAAAIDSAFTDSGQVNEINGESINTGSVGTIEELEQSNIGGVFYDERPEITNGSGVIMAGNGQDYTWFDNNGTFRVESSALANNNGVTVDYAYAVPNQNQDAFASFFGNYIDVLVPLALFFLTVALIIGAMMRLGRA